MDKKLFTKLLKEAGLNKVKLAEISEIPYATVNAWGSRTPYPPYIKSWLENYISKQKFDIIKEAIKDKLD